jgi:hypothetical protein
VPGEDQVVERAKGVAGRERLVAEHVEGGPGDAGRPGDPLPIRANCATDSVSDEVPDGSHPNA